MRVIIAVVCLAFVPLSFAQPDPAPVVQGATWKRMGSGQVDGYTFYDATPPQAGLLPDGAAAIASWPNNPTATLILSSGSVPAPLPGWLRGKPTLIDVDPSHGAPESASVAWRWIDTKAP